MTEHVHQPETCPYLDIWGMCVYNWKTDEHLDPCDIVILKRPDKEPPT